MNQSPVKLRPLSQKSKYFSCSFFTFSAAIKGKNVPLLQPHHLLNHQSISCLCVGGFLKILDSLIPDLVIYIVILGGKKMHWGRKVGDWNQECIVIDWANGTLDDRRLQAGGREISGLCEICQFKFSRFCQIKTHEVLYEVVLCLQRSRWSHRQSPALHTQPGGLASCLYELVRLTKHFQHVLRCSSYLHLDISSRWVASKDSLIQRLQVTSNSLTHPLKAPARLD